MSKRSLTGVRVVKKRLADGTVKTYHYTRKTGASKHRQYDADSVAALVQSFQRSPEWRALAPRTRSVYQTYLRDVLLTGGKQVHSVTPRLIIDMRNVIAEGRGNGAGTGFIRAASALFTWAVENKWLEHSPTIGIKALPGGELQAWTMEEAAIAMARLEEPYRRIVMLALYTGQRRGDLCALTWAAYDGQAIKVKQEKTGAEVTIPVHPELKREMDTWKRVVHLHGRILTTEGGQPWRPEHMSKMMHRVLPRIGLSGALNVHGLRKLAATRLAEAGCSAHEIAAITGHKTLAMVAHYTKSADQARMAQTAIGRLPVSSPVCQQEQPPKKR